MFPPDDVLIARGKYSTLTKERREQLERVQSICSTMVTAAQAALRDCEARPPVNKGPIDTMTACLTNLQASRERIITLCAGLAELEDEAWPK